MCYKSPLTVWSHHITDTWVCVRMKKLKQTKKNNNEWKWLRSLRLVVEGFLWSCCFCAGIMNKFKLQRAIRAHSQGQHSDAKVSAHLFGFFLKHMDSERDWARERFNIALTCNEVKSVNWFLMWKWRCWDAARFWAQL